MSTILNTPLKEKEKKCAGSCCGQHEHAPDESIANAANDTTRDVPQGYVRTQWRIAQMDCPTEEKLIRKKLDGNSNVKALDFNLMQGILTVVHTQSSGAAIEADIRQLDMTPEIVDDNASPVQQSVAPINWRILTLSGVTALGAEVAHWLGQPEWLVAALALLSILACGLTTYKKGWIAIRNGNLNINALMSIAVTGAVLIGQWPEAAMVMFLFTIAELIEARSLDRARNAVSGLMALTPEIATVRQSDGNWQEIPAAEVMLDAVVRVRPGERIALDGVLTAGGSAINQAPITGESLPVEKTVGDSVFAGTINESGSFEYRVTAVAGNTTLARIIHAVAEAQGSRAPMQRFVDKFASIYTPAVFLIALAVAVVPPLLLGGVWLDWIYKALVLLVIACPCALVISTPVTIVSGLASAARRGILIKGGVYLELGRKINWLALDKTGTITHGKPVQTDFQLIAGDERRVKILAASLAARSDHPVSRAVAQAAEAEQLPLAQVDDFAALAGRGVQGVIDGTLYRLGNHRLIEELNVCSPQLEARLDGLEQQGKTTIMLTDGQQVLGMFAVADTVREGSRIAIDQLHQLGVKTLMLTGDNPHTAVAIAGQVGIDEAHGDQLPENKLAVIEVKQAAGECVAMVGDGINDAPALAKADIGFAMGAAGTDTAIETADVALMDDDLRKIGYFIRLSRHTYNVLMQNIVLALGIKAVFLVLTLMGTGTMWMAVFADMGASLLVVFNGLRLLRPLS